MRKSGEYSKQIAAQNKEALTESKENGCLAIMIWMVIALIAAGIYCIVT